MMMKHEIVRFPQFQKDSRWDYETSQTLGWSLLLDDSNMMPTMFSLVQTPLFMGESFVSFFVLLWIILDTSTLSS